MDPQTLDVAGVMEIGDGVAGEAIAGQVEHVGVVEIDPPAVPLEDVLLDDPMEGLPGRPLLGEIADGGDAGAVIVAADVSPQDRVARRPKHEHDAGMGASGEMGGIVRPVGAAVATGFVLEKLVLVGGAEPEAVAAAVGLVADPPVPRRPSLDAVVVGVGAVVPLEDVAGAHPAVQNADEDAVPAMGAVVAGEAVVVGAALNQAAGRITGMDLAGIDADPVGEPVGRHRVATRVPQGETGVGRMGKVVVDQFVVVRTEEDTAVPDSIGPVVGEPAAGHALKEDPAAPPVLPPPEARVVEIVGEVAPLYPPAFAITDMEPTLEAAGAEVLHRHPRHPLGPHRRAGERLRIPRVRPEEERPPAVEGDARRLHHDRAIDGVGIEDGVGGDFEDRPIGGGERRQGAEEQERRGDNPGKACYGRHPRPQGFQR